MGYGPAVEVEMDNSNLYEELTGIVFSESEFGRDSETRRCHDVGHMAHN